MIGTAGTASLIRILRGSLLDELAKQYVITARAKGMSERNLLFKYPVRLAVNPIISTVGWVLPAIVSGETIVAIVLGLPTIGPLYLASQWQLMWRKFQRHKLALAGGSVLALLYLGAIFCELLAPGVPKNRHIELVFAPPQRVRLFHDGRLRAPFVYALDKRVDARTLQPIYTPDRSRPYPVRLFVRGEPYKLWGLFDADLHVLGVDDIPLFLFGSDKFGRDLLTRSLYASRVSLSVGLVGVALSFILGLILGGVSGYYGGTPDLVIQRLIEFLISLPIIPVWMALAAALPPQWSSIQVYFAVTVILSIVGWTGLARVIRGKLLELREADFVMAAAIAGSTPGATIGRHLLPSFLSYLIVHLTLAVPGMILGETALSFLGLGIRPPAVSWGTLLQDAQNVHTMVLYPWLLLPSLLVVVAVLMFNFLGDGLREAADPYK